MRHLRISIASLCVLAMILAGSNIVMAGSSAPGGESSQGRLQGKPATGISEQYVPGQVIVKYKSGVSAQSRGSIMSTVGGAEVLKEIGPPHGEKAELVKLEPGVSVEQAVAELNARPDVQYAEPNYVYHATYEPNDPSYGEQWGFKNDGQKIKDSTGTKGADIDAEGAWDIEQGYSNPVTVAIIDTGCDFTHPDLKSKLLSNGYNYAGISQTSVNNKAPAGQWENWYFAQSIKGTGGKLTHVGIVAQTIGSPTGNIYVGVRTSLPTSDPFSTLGSYTVSPSEVSSEGSEIYKALNNPVTLQNGQTYYLLIWTDNVDASLATGYNLFYSLGSDKYLDGCGWYYNNTQGWVQCPNDDFYFRTNANGNPRDDNGHGTHCAGIAAAVTNNGVGVAGTCPAAKVLPIKVLNAAGSGSSDAIANGIYYAADKGAKIISMSIQGPAKSNAAQEACTYAYNKGCTLFAAAGNTGDSTMNYPAGYDHTIGVGATTNKDEKAGFSTYNKSVDLSAPGKDIYSTLPTYPVTFNAEGHSKNHDYLDGTSMACPMAAGVGALLKARSPTVSPAEIEESLESTADDLGTKGRDDKFGYGRVNAARALGGGPQYTWYLAEGTTAWGFDTYVTIQNPNAEALTAKVTYQTKDGERTRPDVSLPASSQTVINPRNDIGSTDFSTKVECKQGKTIAVDRTMSWGDTSGDGHCSIGVTSPSNTWYLPEGSSAWGFECWLLIQNPNSSDATATVTYMIEGEGPQVFQKNVPASSRATYNMEQDIGNKDASIKVESNVPVIPERAMYRNSRAEGHDSIGTTSPAQDYYLAEGTTAWGFTTYVLIQNPQGTENQVNVTYMTPSGEQSHPENPITMPANSRKTIRVNDFVPNTDLSTRVTGNNPIIAERAMYWDGPSGERCHDSIGMAFPHTTFYLPDGETSNGRETWTLVQNPNSSDVEVRITYLTPDGQGNVTFTENISANSRSTFSMADRGINGRAAVLVTCTTSGKKIMVERAMYWNNRGAGTDTIGGYSD